MHVIHTKFLKETVIKVSGATLLAIASILFVPATTHAVTTYETPGTSGEQTVDYTCGNSTCRNAQLGSMMSDYIPVGITFDKIQIVTNSTTTAPRLSLEFDYDTGEAYDSCTDATCWNDNTTFYAVPGAYTGWTHVADGVWERELGTTITSSSSLTQLQFQYDTETPYQVSTYEYTSNGQRRNALFLDDQIGSAVFQLCIAECQPFGSWIENRITFNSRNNTRFTSLDITGTTSLSFEVGYFLDANEINTSVSALNPSIVAIKFLRAVGDPIEGFGESIDTSVFGESTVTLTKESFEQGNYTAQIYFSNPGCSIGFTQCPFSDSYIIVDFKVDIDGEVFEIGTPEFYDLSNELNDNIAKYSECSVTKLAGCFQNVIIWSLVPNEDITAYLGESLEQHSDKVPFNYIYLTYDTIEDLSNSTSSFSGFTIPTSVMWDELPDFEAIPSDFWATGTPKEISDVIRPVSELWLYLFTFLGLGLRALAYVRNIKHE